MRSWLGFRISICARWRKIRVKYERTSANLISPPNKIVFNFTLETNNEGEPYVGYEAMHCLGAIAYCAGKRRRKSD